VTLPDSSRVLMASDTRVQMVRFDQADIAHAQFVVDHGKVRFQVEHPTGTQSDYTFKTPSANIAVRGTEGDIGVDDNGLTVNVYNSNTTNTSNNAPAPVEVTLTTGKNAGKVLQIFPGQSLVAKLVNGVLKLEINRLTDQAMNEFAELGIPTNVQQASDAAMAKARSLLPALPSIPGLPRIPFPH
jgi:hypothetical protein